MYVVIGNNCGKMQSTPVIASNEGGRSFLMILISQDAQALPESCDTSNYQAVACQGASLVETANLHFPSKGDSERFCAKHICKRRIRENKRGDSEIRLRPC